MSERENISGSRGEYGECLKARQKFNMELYNRCLKDLCKTIERQRTEWDDFQKESAKRKDSPKRNGMPNDNLAEVAPQKNLQESLLFEILEIVKNLEKNFQCLCEHLSKKETFKEEVRDMNAFKEEVRDMNGKTFKEEVRDMNVTTFKGEVRDMYGKMSSEEFWKNREEVPPLLIRKIEAAESKKLHKSLEVFSPKKPEGPIIITQEEQRNGDNARTAQTESENLQEGNGPLKITIREDESIKMQEDIIFVPEERSFKAESGKLLSIRSSKKQYEMKPVTKTESFVERLISGRSSKKISREGSVAEMKIEKTHFERKKTPNLEQFFIHKDAEATTPGGNQGKQNQEQTKPESRQPSEIQEISKPESKQPSEMQEMSKPESRQPSEMQEMSKPESKQPSEIQEISKPGSKQPSEIQEISKPGSKQPSEMQEMSKPESKQPSEIQEQSKRESKQPSRTSGAGTPKKQENEVREAVKRLSASQAKNDSEKEEVASLEKPNSA